MNLISRRELERVVKYELAQAHKEFYGVGPGFIITDVVRNFINFKIDRCLTPLEKQLALENNLDVVHDMRQKMIDRLKNNTQIRSIFGVTLLDSMGKVLPEHDVLYGVLVYDKDLPVTS